MMKDVAEALNDASRLESLRRTGVLGGDPDPVFNRFTRLVARTLKVPTSLLSFLGADRHYVQGSVGLGEPWTTMRELPLTHSICQYVVATGEPLVVHDAREHPFLLGNRAVSECGFVSYVGVPLAYDSGRVLGALCAVDTSPHAWDPNDLATLQDLAQLVNRDLGGRVERHDPSGDTDPHACARRLGLAQRAVAFEFFRYDAASRTIESTPEALRLHGLPAGRSTTSTAFLAAVHPDDRPRVREAAARMLTSDEAQAAEYRVVGADGTASWIEAVGRRLRDPTDRVLGAEGVVHDVSPRKSIETALALHAQELRDLGDVAVRISSALNLEVVLKTATHAAGLLIGAHQSALYLRGENGSPWLECVSLTDRYAGYRKGADPEPAPSFVPPPEAIAKPLRIEPHELAGHPVMTAAGAPPGGPPLRGWLSAPLVGRYGQELGFLRLSDRSDGEFTDADLARLVVIAQTAALAVENARLLQLGRRNDRQREVFLASLAHELRNPLAAINNAVALIRMTPGGGPPQLDWSIGLIERQVQSLVRLIDGLIDVSRLTRGKIALRPESVDVKALLGQMEQSIQAMMSEKSHSLLITTPAGPLWVKGDPLRLEQILTNLLSNAAKFTPNRGQISLELTREGDEAVFRIADNGQGIAPETLPQIFDLFAQEERPSNRAEGGLGIGLTLVKRLVDLHGGSVDAASEGGGRGATFTVRIPVEEPESSAPASRRADMPSGLAASSLVLIADDNVDLAEGLSRLIKTFGYAVMTVHDGPSAIEAAIANKPGLCLIDIGLPGLDGYEVVRRLQGVEALKQTCFIAISGYDQPADVTKSSQAGFIAHFVKPVDVNVLRKILAHFPRST